MTHHRLDDLPRVSRASAPDRSSSDGRRRRSVRAPRWNAVLPLFASRRMRRVRLISTCRLSPRGQCGVTNVSAGGTVLSQHRATTSSQSALRIHRRVILSTAAHYGPPTTPMLVSRRPRRYVMLAAWVNAAANDVNDGTGGDPGAGCGRSPLDTVVIRRSEGERLCPGKSQTAETPRAYLAAR